VTDAADGPDTGSGTTVSRAITLIDDRGADESLAEAGLGIDRAESEDELTARLRESAPDCLVVDPAALDSDPGPFRSTVRTIDPTCPVVWLTEPPAELGDDAFGPATTLVERGGDPETWSFLREKVRSVTEGESLIGHGPNTTGCSSNRHPTGCTFSMRTHW
jgi:hypothetical protein